MFPIKQVNVVLTEYTTLILSPVSDVITHFNFLSRAEVTLIKWSTNWQKVVSDLKTHPLRPLIKTPIPLPLFLNTQEIIHLGRSCNCKLTSKTLWSYYLSLGFWITTVSGVLTFVSANCIISTEVVDKEFMNTFLHRYLPYYSHNFSMNNLYPTTRTRPIVKIIIKVKWSSWFVTIFIVYRGNGGNETISSARAA